MSRSKGIAALDQDRRKEIAAKGGRTRCLPRATHYGELNIMDKILPCVVLDSGDRIVTSAAIFRVFNRPQRGSRSSENVLTKVPAFMGANSLKPLMKPEDEPLTKPIHYLSLHGKEECGFKAEVIPVVCELYLQLRQNNDLKKSQIPTAEVSEAIVRSLSKVGIIALIDEATGYQSARPRDELQIYLNKILSLELSEWCKTFPDNYFSNVYAIKRWPWHGMKKNHYQCMGHVTNDLIYNRLGHGILEELKARTPKDEAGNTSNCLHQWLSTEVGHPKLREHISAIMALQRIAMAQGLGWKRFMDIVDVAFPIYKNEEATT